MTEALYDRIGVGYSAWRRPDPRIAARIADALGAAQTIVNVGAGAGSYEPADRAVVAVEPSAEMVRQRPPSAAPAVRASAGRLPFRGRAFDAAMAVLTIHHWPDWRAGIGEMRRVARGPVAILTWDPDHPGFWLVQDYFPEIRRSTAVILPRLAEIDRRPRSVRGAPGAGSRRLLRRLSGRVLATAGDVPGRRRPRRHLHLREDPRRWKPASTACARTWRMAPGSAATRSLRALPELDIGYRLVVA